MSENGHERRSDEIAAYLLGALEPGEAAELERHLAGCEECRTELEWLRPAVRMLPESVERVEAPPQLRGRLMEQVRAEAEGARRRAARTAGASGAGACARLQAWPRLCSSSPRLPPTRSAVAIQGAATRPQS